MIASRAACRVAEGKPWVVYPGLVHGFAVNRFVDMRFGMLGSYLVMQARSFIAIGELPGKNRDKEQEVDCCA
jgi:hypothetical protein